MSGEDLRFRLQGFAGSGVWVLSIKEMFVFLPL